MAEGQKVRGIYLGGEVVGEKVLKTCYPKRANGRDTFSVASAVGVRVVDKTKAGRDSFGYDNFFVIGHDRSGVRFPCPGRDPRMCTYLEGSRSQWIAPSLNTLTVDWSSKPYSWTSCRHAACRPDLPCVPSDFHRDLGCIGFLEDQDIMRDRQVSICAHICMLWTTSLAT